MEIITVNEPGTSLQYVDKIKPLHALEPVPVREDVYKITPVYDLQYVDEIKSLVCS